MNDRIRELFRQAGGKTSTRNLASNPVQVVETHELYGDHIEKFAELIVRDCMAAIQEEMDTGLYNNLVFAGLRVSKTVIKDRFGVKDE